MSNRLVFISIALISVGLYVFFTLTGLFSKTEIDLAESVIKLDEYNSSYVENIEKTGQWISQFNPNSQSDYFEAPNQVERNLSIEPLLSDFFGSILINDIDLFVSYFIFDDLIEDLGVNEPEDRIQQLHEIMNVISNDNTLTSVEIGRVKDKGTYQEVQTTLIFENTPKRNLTLNLIFESPTYHDEHDLEILYIENSVWDILAQFNEETGWRKLFN